MRKGGRRGQGGIVTGTKHVKETSDKKWNDKETAVRNRKNNGDKIGKQN